MLTRYKYLIKLIIFSVFFFIVIELFSSFIVKNKWIIASTSPQSNSFWRLSWFMRHFENPSQTTIYSIDEHHPLLGWSPSKNAKNVPIGKANVNINSDGVRGLKTYSLEKNPKIKRIAVFGDSFSFGEDVNDEETYVARLEKNIQNTEVINLAVRGYGLDQMTLRLSLDGFKYNPDIIIYAFTSDDINRVFLNFRDYAKPKYELVNGKLELQNTPIPDPKTLIESNRYRLNVLDAFSILRDRIIFRNTKNYIFEPLVEAILKQTVVESKEHQSVPIFLYLPTGQEMNQPNNQPEPEKMMFSFCNLEKINCFSARKYFSLAYKNGTRFDPFVHYEAYTHKIIASGLAEDLKKITILKDIENPAFNR